MWSFISKDIKVIIFMYICLYYGVILWSWRVRFINIQDIQLLIRDVDVDAVYSC